MTTITFGGKPVLRPDWMAEAADRNDTPDPFWMRANSYTNSLGRSPGTAWLLLLESDLDELGINAAHDLVFTDHERRSVTIKNLTIVRAMNVTRAPANAVGRVFFLECKDSRYNLARYPANAHYNARDWEPDEDTGDNYWKGKLGSTASQDDTLNDGSPWTWNEVLQDLWDNHMPSFVPDESTPSIVGSIGDATDDVPAMLRYSGEQSTWKIINEIVEQFKHFSSYNPATEAFQWLQVDVSTSFDEQITNNTSMQNRLLWDYDPKATDRALVPEIIRVFFRSLREKGNAVIPRLAYSEDVLTNDPNAIAGTVHAIWSGMPALYRRNGGITPASESVTNSAETDNHADLLAALELSRLKTRERRMSRVYSGIIEGLNPEPSGAAQITYADYGDDRGMITLLARQPQGIKPPHRAGTQQRQGPTVRFGVTDSSIGRGGETTVTISGGVYSVADRALLGFGETLPAGTLTAFAWDDWAQKWFFIAAACTTEGIDTTSGLMDVLDVRPSGTSLPEGIENFVGPVDTFNFNTQSRDVAVD